MRISIKTFAASAIGSLAFILLSSKAKALPTASVTVGGTQYNITYFQGDYNSNIAKFETPANNGLMPWWGNGDLAVLFSDALGLQLGKAYGPHFAFFATEVNSELLIDAIANAGSGSFFTGAIPEESRAYAILATPTAVPGPAPLLGAAAAFGMTRRLRRRIKLGA
ncbi:MAG: hypothetical protein ACKOZW_01985 [Cyanobium sp.]